MGLFFLFVCLMKQFAICLSVFVILLLNGMEVFSVGGDALLDRLCMVFQRICVLCLGSFYMFCLCFCMSEVISSFKSLRAGSQVFALLMLFFCMILHTMWSGKNLQLLSILPFGMLCLSAISMMVKKKYVGKEYGGLSESGLCVFRELCPVSFLVVGETPSVLL